MQPQCNEIPLPLEEWRPVVGYEGWYDVSSLGRVRRIRPGSGTRRGRLLKPCREEGGYLHVGVSIASRVKIRNVHRLVAEAFLGPCPPGCEANHKNGIKIDNRPSNLEWVTPAANIRHAYTTRLIVAPQGERQGRAKLTEADVRAIRTARGKTSLRELARRFGVHYSSIGDIQARRTWVHVT